MGVIGGGYMIQYEQPTGRILNARPAALSLSGTSESVSFVGTSWEAGPLITLEAGQTSSEITGTFSVQVADIQGLSLVLNKGYDRMITINDFPDPFLRSAASNAITVDGLTEDQTVLASCVSKGKERTLLQIPAASTLDTGQFQVTANTITFFAGDFADGDQIVGTAFKPASSPGIGGPSAAEPYKEVSFYGELLALPKNIRYWLPKTALTSEFDWNMLGDAGGNIDVNFIATTPTDKGFNTPYVLLFRP